MLRNLRVRTDCVKLSNLNRSYQQSIVAILKTIKNPSDETRVACFQAENIAFDVEIQIGKKYRSLKK